MGIWTKFCVNLSIQVQEDVIENSIQYLHAVEFYYIL